LGLPQLSGMELHRGDPPPDRPVWQSENSGDFQACPVSVIQRSASFEGEVGVVLLEDGETDEDYQGLDVAGQVVLTRAIYAVYGSWPSRSAALRHPVRWNAARSPGAPGRRLGRRAPIHFLLAEPGDTYCFGFVLTPRQGQELRHLLKKGNAPVRVWAKVVSRLYDGAMEVVSGTIPGESDGRGPGRCPPVPPPAVG